MADLFKERRALEAWLSSLKVGDEVFRTRGGPFDRYQTIETVERVTAAQIILKDDERFWRKNGEKVGSQYIGWIEPVTDEIRSQMLRNEKLAAISSDDALN